MFHESRTELLGAPHVATHLLELRGSLAAARDRAYSETPEPVGD